ncbi:MAG: hypothetical protein CL943_02320 [Candidatus Diapherotrites archaeon]|uniref:Uncharacterized protein n=1 Tax=Candidatus Iainarchaeum sp. TaxID=3101447 RepID=A0A2D6M120_9ARCH|nr:hypothetical protein [Candidatus Diapherotrites archaeon]|tara:strand:+ start:10449 stop:10958 length:510 start_codon:yes stop_codon:yes gene_type:complete
MKKIFFVVLTLILFLSNTLNVFAATCPTGGGCIATCTVKTEGSCGNYYEVKLPGTGNVCNWNGSACKTDTACTVQCTMGNGCTASFRAATSNCGNIAPPNCYDYFHSTLDYFCWQKGPATCDHVGAAQCVPEFAGIEFGDMAIPTGIIALIAAIILPTVLFKKKKIGKG